MRERCSSQKKEIQNYKAELLSQMKLKKEKDNFEKTQEKNIMKEYFISEIEKDDKRSKKLSEYNSSAKESLIRVNSELLDIKKKNSNLENEKRLFEIEKDKKIRELYTKELKEIKQNNDKYKKLMVNMLSKQVEEKKKKDQQIKEERKSIRINPEVDFKKKLSFSKI